VSLFRFVAAEKANFPTSLLCRMLGVSRSGFHAWERRAPSNRDLADAWLVERIGEIHRESRQSYGARRVHAALAHRGVRVGRKRVERLMRLRGLSGLVPKRCRRTTIRVPGVRVADDLVDRDFAPVAPNELWCADIKYVRTWQGWLCLGAVIDCYSRRVVGWSMRPDLEAELVVDALEMAIARRRPKPGLVHHSDQGSPPTSRSASASAAARSASTARWAPRETASTTPSPRASSPRSRTTCSAAAPSPPGKTPGRRSSTTSRRSTTRSGSTPHSATCRRSNTRR
jgi:putative transposase